MARIQIIGKAVNAVFLRRVNRFLASVRVDDRVVSAFLPNPGRMQDILIPESQVILAEVPRNGRKTSYDLIGVHVEGEAVSVDSRVPNKLVAEALKSGEIEELSGYSLVRPEYFYGSTRFDFLLTHKLQKCLLEVKSCTLVREGLALFPDAPTKRGTRQVSELIAAKLQGYRSCMLFIIQRNYARVFAVNDQLDPKLGTAVRAASNEGVEVYAYSSQLSGKEVCLKGRVKVKLGQARQASRRGVRS